MYKEYKVPISFGKRIRGTDVGYVMYMYMNVCILGIFVFFLLCIISTCIY